MLAALQLRHPRRPARLDLPARPRLCLLHRRRADASPAGRGPNPLSMPMAASLTATRTSGRSSTCSPRPPTGSRTSADRVEPYLGREVLEVGAGHGGTTRVLTRHDDARWVCLEPDPALAARLAGSIAAGELPVAAGSSVGTLADLAASRRSTRCSTSTCSSTSRTTGRAGPGRRPAQAGRPRDRPLAGPPVALHPLRPGDRPLPPLHQGHPPGRRPPWARPGAAGSTSTRSACSPRWVTAWS